MYIIYILPYLKYHAPRPPVKGHGTFRVPGYVDWKQSREVALGLVSRSRVSLLRPRDRTIIDTLVTHFYTLYST